MTCSQGTPATKGILIVDDEDPVRLVIARALRAAGYTVHHASSGEEAAAIAAGLEPLALALVDVALGAERGPAVVARLRGERPALRIAYISGRAPEDLTDAAQDGDAGFLPKPFGADDVVRFVGETLEPHRDEPDLELRLLKSLARALPKTRRP